jgi:hypothetical protein
VNSFFYVRDNQAPPVKGPVLKKNRQITTEMREYGDALPTEIQDKGKQK